MYYILVIIIVLCLLNFGYYNIIQQIEEVNYYKLGTGYEDGSYETIGKILEKETPVNLALVNSNGTLDNLSKVNSKTFSFGIAQEELFYDSFNGLNAYKKVSPYINLRFISGLYFEMAHFIVNNNIEEDVDAIIIDDFYDMKKYKGLKIGVGEVKSGSEFNFKLLCLLNDIYPINIEKEAEYTASGKTYDNIVLYVNGTINSIFNKFVNKEIDGIYLMLGANNVYIDNLVTLVDIKFIDLLKNQTLLTDIYSDYFYKKQINTSDYYSDPMRQKKINTIGIRVILFSNDTTPEKEVYDIVKTIYTKNHKFRNNSEQLYTLEYEPIDMSYCRKEYIMHPGAEKYYKEVNLISTDKKKFENDLYNYSQKVVKHYWNIPEIGLRKFNLELS
jgi:TRAP transporter TAXI family solute receptor